MQSKALVKAQEHSADERFADTAKREPMRQIKPQMYVKSMMQEPGAQYSLLLPMTSQSSQMKQTSLERPQLLLDLQEETKHNGKIEEQDEELEEEELKAEDLMVPDRKGSKKPIKRGLP